MSMYSTIKNCMGVSWENVKFHLFETDDVFIYWPNFQKGLLLLVFALVILFIHLIWYLLNYH